MGFAKKAPWNENLVTFKRQATQGECTRMLE